MKNILPAVFILYLVVLVKLVLFKGSFFYQVVPASDYYKIKSANASFQMVNLVPFYTIKLFLTNDYPFAVKFYNLFGNILLFVPFGLLLPLLSNEKLRFAGLLGLTCLVSLSFELFQLFTQTGQFDVDDILLNTVGGTAGYLIFLLLKKKGLVPYLSGGSFTRPSA